MIKIKKIKNADPEIRHLGSMIESVNDGVKLIAEQYGDIKGTLDNHTKILNSHTEMIGNLTVVLEIVKKDLKIVKNDFKTTKIADHFSMAIQDFSVII